MAALTPEALRTLTDLEACATDVFEYDPLYVLCVYNSGILVQSAVDNVCTLSCPKTSWPVGSDCCQVVTEAQACQSSSEESKRCQVLFNKFILDVYECDVPSDVIFAIVVVGLSLLLGLLCIIYKVSRARLDSVASEAPSASRKNAAPVATNGAYLDGRNQIEGIGDNTKPSSKADASCHQSRRRGALLRPWLALSRKNLIVAIRHPVSTSVNIVLPMMLAAVMVALVRILDDSGGAIETVQPGGPASLVCDSIVLGDVLVGGVSGDALEVYQRIKPVGGLFFLVCFIKLTASMEGSIVREKENRLVDLLKSMGARTISIMLSWVLSYFTIFVILAMGLSVLLVYGGLFPQSSLAELVFFFLAFGLAMITFCLLVSAFFTSARPAAFVCCVIWLLLFMIFFGVHDSPPAVQGIACLSAPACFGIGIYTLFDGGSFGSGWSYEFASETNQLAIALSPIACAWLMLVDACLYLAFAWYLEIVLPNEYGVREHWNFLCRKLIEVSTSDAKDVVDPVKFDAPRVPKSPTNKDRGDVEGEMLEISAGEDESAILFEELATPKASAPSSMTEGSSDSFEGGVTAFEEPSELELSMKRSKRCVTAIDVSCRYSIAGGGKKLAVANMTFDLFEGELSVLLGPNGAGKSTTVNMLSGFVRPSAGLISCYGYSLANNLQDVRMLTGVCPQGNVLFMDLTVSENVALFVALKNFRFTEATRIIVETVKEAGLTDRSNCLARNLSGGQKRKLCLAIAFIGNAKVIILDEPTAGMDPLSRAQAGEYIRRKKEGRVVLLVTHFLDEAEKLGDRLMIISDGKLLCSGSSSFLRRRFGKGYSLSLTKVSESGRAAIMTALSEYAMDSAILCNNLSSVSVQFAADRDQLFRFLKSLEGSGDLQERGIKVSMTSLEEVFLAAAASHGKMVMRPGTTTNARNVSSGAHVLDVCGESAVDNGALVLPKVEVRPKAVQQLLAMLRKRLWVSRRDRRWLLFTLIIPLVFLLALLFIPAIDITDYMTNVQTSSGDGGSTEGRRLQTSEEVEEATQLCLSSFTTNPFALTPFGTDGTFECCDPEHLVVGSSYTACLLTGRPPCAAGMRSITQAEVSFRCARRFRYCDVIGSCDRTVCCDWTSKESPYYPCNMDLTQHVPLYTKDCIPGNFFRLQSSVNSFLVSIIMVIGFSFIPAAVVVYVVKEKERHRDAKLLQLISGAGLIPYWLSLYLWDVLTSTLPIAVALACLPFYAGFHASNSTAYVCSGTIMALYILSIIPITYLLSFFFKVHSKAQIWMLSFSFITGIILGIVCYSLVLLDDFETLYSILRHVSLMFPGFALQDGLFRVSNWHVDFCFWSTSCSRPSMFSFSVAGWNIMYMSIEACLFPVTVWVCEKCDRERKLRHSASRLPPAVVQAKRRAALAESIEVVQERVRIEQELGPEECLVLKSVSKMYGDGKVALGSLSLGVRAGECFGLLGHNGAGKSSTMNILTGGTSKTSGDVYVNGVRVADQPWKALHFIGFCPQDDYLLDLLSVDEHLKLFANIRGIPRKRVADCVAALTTALKLSAYRDKPAYTLSAGNKRKVSVAIALLGTPPLLLLDEASTGMDPIMRRELVDLLLAIRDREQTAILLTTHSMIECEALCDRIGVLREGSLDCLGQIAHIRERFKGGYRCLVKLAGISDLQKWKLRSQLQESNQMRITRHNLSAACEDLGDASAAQLVHSADDGWVLAYHLDTLGYVAADDFCRWWVQRMQLEAFVKHLESALQSVKVQEKRWPYLVIQVYNPGQGRAEVLEALQLESSVWSIDYFEISDNSFEQLFDYQPRIDGALD